MRHLRTTVASLAALSLTAGLAAGALAQDEAEAEMSPGPIGVFSIEDMDWRLSAQVVDGEMTAVPEGVVVSLRMSDGEAGGVGGCNNYSAGYSLDGFELSFSPIRATLMACPEPQSFVEATYFANLSAVTAYQSGGIQMALLDADGAFLLEFDLAPPGSVEGDWVATGINDGAEAVVSSEMTSSVTASFGEDGTLSGSDGCNQYSTSYELDGDAIKIDDAIVVTQMACPDDDFDAQAEQYYAALTAATTWSVDVGGSLELRDDAGALQVRFQPAEA